MKFLLLVLLFSCNAQTDEPVSPYHIECRKVGDGMLRCENEEVICYQLYGSALQCKFNK